MSDVNAASEQSMDEILASIRRMISTDPATITAVRTPLGAPLHAEASLKPAVIMPAAAEQPVPAPAQSINVPDAQELDELVAGDVAEPGPHDAISRRLADALASLPKAEAAVSPEPDGLDALDDLVETPPGEAPPAPTGSLQALFGRMSMPPPLVVPPEVPLDSEFEEIRTEPAAAVTVAPVVNPEPELPDVPVTALAIPAALVAEQIAPAAAAALPEPVAAPLAADPAIAPVVAAVAAVAIPAPEPAPVLPVSEDAVAKLLQPMLRQWLDDNMPRIVEKALRNGLDGGAKTG
jgi:cell pole-organizing protein PopZ